MSNVAVKKELKDINRKRNGKRNSTNVKIGMKKEEVFAYGFEGNSNQYNEEYSKECRGD
ncbi:hypothetical protein Glove_19g43 [Diversispora epigaea]|uniref:Uncharacterized protein n=1 Tax=Diversispora epigaea TaxID=1348612 RepID=A0A397JWZ6_9GLOM|nr:hypothetical protein Glove_19g43 [Diversispora epigaea]